MAKFREALIAFLRSVVQLDGIDMLLEVKIKSHVSRFLRTATMNAFLTYILFVELRSLQAKRFYSLSKKYIVYVFFVLGIEQICTRVFRRGRNLPNVAVDNPASKKYTVAHVLLIGAYFAHLNCMLAAFCGLSD